MKRRRPSRLQAGVALVAGLAVVAGVVFLTGVATPKESTTPRGCEGSAAIDFGCYQQRYDDFVRIRGTSAALATLAQERQRNGYVKIVCHQLTHLIGRSAAGEHGVRAYGLGNTLCSSGYYHGVTEAVMGRLAPTQALARAGTVCAAQREHEPYSYNHYNCIHGMGHGFMSIYRSDVPRSLGSCDVLGERWERKRCYSGVFMENLTAINNPTRPTKYLKPDRPLYPCTAVAPRYKPNCYDQQTSYALFVRNENFADVFALCAAVKDKAFRPSCYQGLGGNASSFTSKTITGKAAIAETVRRLCLLGRTPLARSKCVFGAVNTTIRDHQHGGDVISRRLCATFRANERDLRETCLRAIVAAKAEFGPPRSGQGAAAAGMPR